jgi:hypothetical protein
MLVTLSADDDAAHWQSPHDGCAAANATRSTGEVETGKEASTAAACAELAAKVGIKDPEGAFTSILSFAAIGGERFPSD